MGLTRYKLGELIALSEKRNKELALGFDDVRGISIQKEFIPTKADMTNVSLRPYYLVEPDKFAYVPDTSRRGDKITLAHNDSSDETYLVSSSYVVFGVSKPTILLSDFLFMYFNRPEFDRYARFNSWGSARETFTWDDMCDIDIYLPPIKIQQKYVDIYNAMLANQKAYERGLDDLQIMLEGFVDNLKHNAPLTSIGKYLHLSDVRNTQGLDVNSVRGIATSKQLIPTKADMKGVKLNNYKLLVPGTIAYVPDTSRRGEKISLAQNTANVPYIVSSISTAFDTDRERLLPDYLMLFLCRPEFDRYARFNSWGSARETFDWSAMCDAKIPIPSIEIQRAVSLVYKVYLQRRTIAEQMEAQLKNLCPILIKGSLDEAAREEVRA